MRCPDCGLGWGRASRGCGRCAGVAPRVIASGKTCPECGEVTYLSRAVCAGCGHTYRTIFPNRLAPPDAGVPPPEAPAGRARGVFLIAWVLMTGLATGLIFYLVNHF